MVYKDIIICGSDLRNLFVIFACIFLQVLYNYTHVMKDGGIMEQGVIYTEDIKTFLICLLIVAGIVLAIYLIVAVYNLIKTLKQSQKVLDDFEVAAHISAERLKQLDKFIEQTSKKVKNSQNIFNALPIILRAVTEIAKVAGRKREEAAAKK